MTHLTSKDFVLWNGRSFGPGRAQFKSLKEANAFIEAPVAREYTELVEALTRMYGRIGMHEVCRLCFAGKELPAIPKNPWFKHAGHHGNHGNGPGKGCCAPCGLQGHKGCLSKPLGCAMWMCHYTSERFKSTSEFVNRSIRPLITDVMGWGYGFFHDPRPKTLDAHQRYVLRVARWAVEAWET